MTVLHPLPSVPLYYQHNIFIFTTTVYDCPPSSTPPCYSMMEYLAAQLIWDRMRSVFIESALFSHTLPDCSFSSPVISQTKWMEFFCLNCCKLEHLRPRRLLFPSSPSLRYLLCRFLGHGTLTIISTFHFCINRKYYKKCAYKKRSFSVLYNQSIVNKN